VKYLPPPPPTAGGTLTVTARRISAALVSGTLSGCVICGSSGCHYWPHEGRFHPLHQGCVHRLVEYWQTQLSVDEEEAGTPAAAPISARRGGAYARRAAKAAASVAAPVAAVASGLAPVIPDAVLRNPFWRPGEGPDAPWLVIVETNIGRRVIPAGDADNARTWCARLAVSDYGSSGELLFAGAVMAPDGTLSGAWGGVDGIASPPLYSTLEQLCGRWERCRKCDQWRWPGCWLEDAAGTCADCTVDEVPRPWPVEPPPPGGRTEPPVKVKAKR
jgi:hypothetical protein